MTEQNEQSTPPNSHRAPDEQVAKAEAHNLLEEAFRELDHARVFIRTRQKMHPEGVHQFDEVWAKVRRFLEQHA